MTTIKEPNYKHYRRIKSITADKAKELLAIFELRDKEFCDQDELDSLLAEELKLASSLLFDAIDSGELQYSADECPYDYHPDGSKIYFFNKIQISVADLISWAAKQEYKVPEGLADLSALPKNEVESTDKDKEGDDETKAECKGKKTVAPATDNTKIVDGLLKMVIAMAMDCYGYNPEDRKSTTTADIMKALSSYGLSVSENTIRERLKQAQLLLPRDEKQQKTQ